MPTQHDSIVAALTKRGAKPATTIRTSKYTVLEQATRPGHYWFIGKAGALRSGKTVTASVSLSEDVRRALIAEGANATNIAASLAIGAEIAQMLADNPRPRARDMLRRASEEVCAGRISQARLILGKARACLAKEGV